MSPAELRDGETARKIKARALSLQTPQTQGRATRARNRAPGKVKS
jgi:hypothetical protein